MFKIAIEDPCRPQIYWKKLFKSHEKTFNFIICNSCFSSRLKARILESFQSNQVATICTCYEDSLRRDPTCNRSLQRLIKMHRIGSPWVWIAFLHRYLTWIVILDIFCWILNCSEILLRIMYIRIYYVRRDSAMLFIGKRLGG